MNTLLVDSKKMKDSFDTEVDQYMNGMAREMAQSLNIPFRFSDFKKASS